MKNNYHTHTFRCNHASCTEREYADAAIAGGWSLLGFSDHAPYVFDGDYYSGFRMRPELANDYFETCASLKDEYKGRLEIHIGLEAEFYPKHFDDFLRLIRPYGCEYLILGQHFIDNEVGAPYSGAFTKDGDILRRYTCQVSEALKTGLFSYLAHPDLLNYRGDDYIYTKYMTSLCETAASLHIPLEINLLGIGDNRAYPYTEFWKIAAKTGNEVVIGCDAHSPAVFTDKDVYGKALDIISSLGLKHVERVDLKNVR